MSQIDKIGLRGRILECFRNGMKATKAYRLLEKDFGTNISRSTVSHWFERFKMQNFDLNDKPRAGRPVAFDMDEFRKWIEINPKQSCIMMAREFRCSKTVISRALKALQFIKVDGIWMPPMTQMEDTSVQAKEPEMEVVSEELTLEQKIYTIARYYENGRQFEALLEEFDDKFSVRTANLEDSLKVVVDAFESCGSVTNTLSYSIMKAKEVTEIVMEDSCSDQIEVKFVPKKQVRVSAKMPGNLYPKKCPICHRMISPSTFRNHLRVHGDERAFECEVCQRKFKTKQGLFSHSQIHKSIEERRVNICQICGKRSTQRPNHNKHMKTHQEYVNQQDEEH